jgi:hypothetical protein
MLSMLIYYSSTPADSLVETANELCNWMLQMFA